MDHLKFVETLLNKGIEKGNIITAQIYAKTFIYYLHDFEAHISLSIIKTLYYIFFTVLSFKRC